MYTQNGKVKNKKSDKIIVSKIVASPGQEVWETHLDIFYSIDTKRLYIFCYCQRPCVLMNGSLWPNQNFLSRLQASNQAFYNKGGAGGSIAQLIPGKQTL